VVGFVDDDPALAGRRLTGVRVLGGVSALRQSLERTQPDVVLVTIPSAARDRLDEIVRTCAQLDVTCRFVRREADLDPQAILRATR
jgi:FlaA1/EpsC-like NDP-sugar epimerase